MGALLVYSIASRQTFENCITWLEELNCHADPGILVMLVGNKTDLESLREVPTSAATEFAQKNSLLLIETSARDNTNVNEAFYKLIQEIYKQVNSPHNPLVSEGTPTVPTGTKLESKSLKKNETINVKTDSRANNSEANNTDCNNC
uniref:Uncharacterized protein n=1 Tax=Arcella intermedia TaxID=1963864 RepID=A0A6B2LMF8_9EUKA